MSSTSKGSLLSPNAGPACRWPKELNRAAPLTRWTADSKPVTDLWTAIFAALFLCGLTIPPGQALAENQPAAEAEADDLDDLPGVSPRKTEDGNERATTGLPALSNEDRARLHQMLLEGRAYRARVQAAILLGRRGDTDHDLGALRRALEEDSHYTVRGAAAMAIGNFGSPLGIEPLLEAAADPQRFVRHATHQAIGILASDEKAIPYLLLAREREAVHIRRAAVEALSRIDSTDARAAIVEFLGDRDEDMREEVERVITRWDEDTVVDSLVSGLEHSSFLVRSHAARLAGGYPDDRVINALVDRLVATLEEPRVQVTARESLEELSAHLDVEELIKLLKGVPDREVRIRSIVLLGFHGSDRAVDALIGALEDPDIRIRAYSVMALGQAGNPKAGPRLVSMQENPENSRIQGIIRASLQDLSAVATAE